MGTKSSTTTATTGDVLTMGNTPSKADALAAISAIRQSSMQMGEQYSVIARYVIGHGLSVRKASDKSELDYGKSHLARIVAAYKIAEAYSLTGEPLVIGALVAFLNEGATADKADALAASIKRGKGSIIDRVNRARQLAGKASRAERATSAESEQAPVDVVDVKHVSANGGNVGNEHGGSGASEPKGGDAGSPMTLTERIHAATRALDSIRDLVRADVPKTPAQRSAVANALAGLVASSESLTEVAAEYAAGK